MGVATGAAGVIGTVSTNEAPNAEALQFGFLQRPTVVRVVATSLETKDVSWPRPCTCQLQGGSIWPPVGNRCAQTRLYLKSLELA